jgi:hypothetical protein
MIAKLILTLLLSGVVLYAWREQRRSPLVAKLSLVAATSGMYFVWVPSHASDFAAWAGVGRGVDLIISMPYVFDVARARASPTCTI